jgi:hypothetical protein
VWPRFQGVLKNPRSRFIPHIVILGEAKDLLFSHADNSRCFASLSMTLPKDQTFSTGPESAATPTQPGRELRPLKKEHLVETR